MTSKSKAKGSSYEREIAKLLSDTYGESFIRAAHSGAYVGGINVSRKETLTENQIKSFKGDIVSPDGWHLNIEAKNYADLAFYQIITGKCSQLDTWIQQMMEVADPGDVNMLFFKITRKGSFVCVSSDLTWRSDNFCHYDGKWIIMATDYFFEKNADLLKAYGKQQGKIENE